MHRTRSIFNPNLNTDTRILIRQGTQVHTIVINAALERLWLLLGAYKLLKLKKYYELEFSDAIFNDLNLYRYIQSSLILKNIYIN